LGSGSADPLLPKGFIIPKIRKREYFKPDPILGQKERADGIFSVDPVFVMFSCTSAATFATDATLRFTLAAELKFCSDSISCQTSIKLCKRTTL